MTRRAPIGSACYRTTSPESSRTERNARRPNPLPSTARGSHGPSSSHETTQTPFGLALTADGSLWIADLGIAVAEPAPGQGSVIRVRFDDAGNPVLPYETVRDGLTFPDGLGVYTP